MIMGYLDVVLHTLRVLSAPRMVPTHNKANRFSAGLSSNTPLSPLNLGCTQLYLELYLECLLYQSQVSFAALSVTGELCLILA